MVARKKGKGETMDTTDDKRTLEWLSRLRVLDDEFMRCVFRDQPKLVADVLRILTGICGLVVERIETQRDLKRLAGARSLELDVWCVDGAGRWYDMEVQTGSSANPKRARYHSAVMDVECLRWGDDFRRLPEQWVVFVMEEDPFGEGAARYLFGSVELHTGRRLNDGRRTLYVNGAYRGDDELGRLMADFCQSDPGLIRHEGLRERVEYFKRSEKGVREMSELFKEYAKEYAKEYGDKCREEGAEETLLANIRSVVEGLGMTVVEAMRLLKVPEADQPRYLAML